MKIRFEKECLRELYETGSTGDKKHRYQPEVVRRYQLRVKTLEKALAIEELFPLVSLHYEVLKGDKAGISSIRVDKRYRIEFTVEEILGHKLLTVCNILELSNHYN